VPDSRQLLRYTIAAVALLAGLSFVAVAIVYWALPADSLPTWLPGHKPPSHPQHGHHHKRHGLAAFVLGVASLAVGWTVIREGWPKRR
jgi:hypothetical protein